jgi:hypothetical protein
MSAERYYRCPICGERVVFGEHFCLQKAGTEDEAEPEQAARKKARRDRAKLLGSAIVASILLMALLWQSVGIYSLAAFLLGPLVWLVERLGSRPGKKRDSGDYLELLMLVGRDRATADRLVRAERAKNKNASREECVRAAVEKLERDRSR